MSPQPLKPKELDPAVKAAALNEKKWHGDGTMFAYYGSVDGNIMLGQVTKINPRGDWNAYDLQRTNPQDTGALLIDGSPFAGKAQAKKAVEDYWKVIS